MQLKTNLLPGKSSSYSGPKDNPEICEQIALDCKERGIELSGKEIYSLVGQFFRHIVIHMRLGNFIRLAGIGDFGMTSKEKEKREKIEDDLYYEKLGKNRVKNRVKGYNLKVYRRWKEFNRIREEKGLKPWNLKDWQAVTKDYYKGKNEKIQDRSNVPKKYKPREK